MVTRFLPNIGTKKRPDVFFLHGFFILPVFLDAAKKQLIPQSTLLSIGVIGLYDVALASYKSYDLTTRQTNFNNLMAKAVVKKTLLNRIWSYRIAGELNKAICGRKIILSALPLTKPPAINLTRQ